MIIDAATIPSGEEIDADVCIIGAGPAGLSVASRFLGTRYRVYVLEAGGEHIGDRERDLADGESVGHPYFPIAESRSMVLGGSSYIWEEWMRARPLDPIDFEARPWVRDSGWPFGYGQLEAFYKEAQEMLGLGPYEYEVPEDRPVLVRSADQMTTSLFRYSNSGDFTGMRRELEASANVCLVLHSSALELVPNEFGSQVEHVVASSDNPQRFQVRARVFVVAGGGLENPRLLLLSRGANPTGLGNQHDVVGRYFIEHPTVRRGAYVPGDALPHDLMDLYALNGEGQTGVRAALIPTAAMMEREGILNGMMLLAPSTELESSDAYRSLAIVDEARHHRSSSSESALRHAGSLLASPLEAARALRSMAREDPGDAVFRISMTVEQAPRPDSRVVLGRKQDRFGLPVTALDWRIGDLEKRTMRSFQTALDIQLRRSGLGGIDGFLGDERPKRTLRGEWHQMGTTRMADDPRSGVVDSTCRVHGVGNVYMAGSSVFPTGGHANPTLTIVALGFRLASHLQEELSSSPALGPIW